MQARTLCIWCRCANLGPPGSSGSRRVARLKQTLLAAGVQAELSWSGASARVLHNLSRFWPAAGVQAELILGALERRQRSTAGSASGYLAQRVHYEGEERLMDEEGRGVMMAWEGPLMEAHAKVRQSCSQRAVLRMPGSVRGCEDMAVGGNFWRTCRKVAWPHALLGDWLGPRHCSRVSELCFFVMALWEGPNLMLMLP